ncbi:hypothetical protein Q4561_12660 [Alteromonas sp. 1_MG-2023]|uniref:hypothetical protein n=1 Tax=Alteromonas sp. 1_MG-2023 TaxID=3062669 RepID=UPI0026E2EEE9|nr:hypothetical protein [Alteromonas sp. 1_MG-2023]MDO6567915.1 hypothetical protein [Alteromonas sp. 1_MG-2023]
MKLDVDELRALLEKSEELFNDPAVQEFDSSSLKFKKSTADTQPVEHIKTSTLTKKFEIRSIHHFACSGGSLISKCLDAMPRVRLLSELHPLARKHLQTQSHKFTPSDLISCAYYAEVSDLDELAVKIMDSSIKLSVQHAFYNSEILVFREHSHTDYCCGDKPLDLRLFKRIANENYPNLAIATVRNPIDSFLSLQKNNWVHFSPSTFDEYCKRLNLFLSYYEDEDIFYYEKFLDNPKQVMQEMCCKLDVPFSESFLETYSTRKITGDSGRGAQNITRLKRREVTPELNIDINNSLEYKKFVQRFEYYKRKSEIL